MALKHRVWFALIALAGAALDLVSKHYAHLHVPYGGEIEIIPGLFSFGNTRNTGIVFGWFQNGGVILLIISIVAVPVISLIFLRVRNQRWILTVTLGLILAGTLGNLYDRIFFGYVRDFIKFYLVFGGEEKVWPLFNIADSCICVGVFLLCLEMLFFDEGRSRSPLSAEETVPITTVPESQPTEPAPTVGDETAPIPSPDNPEPE